MREQRKILQLKWYILLVFIGILMFLDSYPQHVYASEIGDYTPNIVEYTDPETGNEYKLEVLSGEYVSTKESHEVCVHKYEIKVKNIGNAQINNFKVYINYYIDNSILYATAEYMFEDHILSPGEECTYTLTDTPSTFTDTSIYKDLKKMSISKISFTHINDDAFELTLPNAIEFNFFSLDEAVQESFEDLKSSLLNPDSIIMYSCGARYTGTEEQMLENSSNDDSEEDYYDRVNVYLYIGAENRMGGITDEAYGYVYDLEGNLLENVSYSDYNEDGYEPSNDMAGLWAQFIFSYASDDLDAWKQYEMSDNKETMYPVGNIETEEETIENVNKIEALAGQLVRETVTSDELNEVSTDIFKNTYTPIDMNQIEDSCTYLSSYATTCEVSVIQVKDSSYIEEIKNMFQRRVDDQLELYSSYNAAETTRLNKAIIKTSGDYAVLCICDDFERAEEILSEAGF